MTQINPLIIGSAKLILPKIIKRGLYGMNHSAMPNDILIRNHYRVFISYFYQPRTYIDNPKLGLDFIITGNIVGALRCEQYCELDITTQSLFTASNIGRNKSRDYLIRLRNNNRLVLEPNNILNAREAIAVKHLINYLYVEDQDLPYSKSLAYNLNIMSNYLLDFYLHRKKAELDLPFLYPDEKWH